MGICASLKYSEIRFRLPLLHQKQVKNTFFLPFSYRERLFFYAAGKSLGTTLGTISVFQRSKSFNCSK